MATSCTTISDICVGRCVARIIGLSAIGADHIAADADRTWSLNESRSAVWRKLCGSSFWRLRFPSALLPTVD